MQRRIRHPFQCDIELAFDADQLLQLVDVHVLESLHLHRIAPPSPWSFARSKRDASAFMSLHPIQRDGWTAGSGTLRWIDGELCAPAESNKRADTRRFMSVWPRRGALGDRATIDAGR